MISRNAHSIKNPQRKHLLVNKKYLCNHSCTTTPIKSVVDAKKVTCKNCKKIIATQKKNINGFNFARKRK